MDQLIGKFGRLESQIHQLTVENEQLKIDVDRMAFENRQFKLELKQINFDKSITMIFKCFNRLKTIKDFQFYRQSKETRRLEHAVSLN